MRQHEARIRATVFWTLVLLHTGANSAFAQIPCNGYEVAHIIKAPPVGGLSSPTIGNGISPDGHYVTGYYTPGSTGGHRAFIFDAWKGELFLIPLGAGFQEAIGESVTNDGVVCGSGVHVQAGKRAFVYDSKSQTWTGLPADGAFGWSSANAINSSHIVCGFRSLNDGGDPVNPRAVYTWSQKSGFADLGVLLGPNAEATDITADGKICGWTGAGDSTSGTRGFMKDGDQLTILEEIPGGLSSNLLAINQNGDGCGFGRFPTPKGPIIYRALSWFDNRISDLGALPGYFRSFALDLNDAGIIVGYSSEPESAPTMPSFKGTVWYDGQVVDVNSLYDPSELTQVRAVHAISSDGVLTGLGKESTDVVGFVLVPEPNILGDIDGNCTVDVDDLLMVINSWGDQNSSADLDMSGVVDIGDLMIVIKNWGGAA